ncbi:MAG: choice-of-anchor Q domain-containing protein [Anaerolineae bacterium]
MKQVIGWLLIVGCLVVALTPRAVYAANAVVGNGTAASCTEAAFDSALATASAGGGVITFNCGPNPVTIAFSVAKIVTLGNVTINGAGRIVLKAGNNERHFFVGPGITFRLQNITLSEGDALVSGGALETSGATVILDNVQLLNNASAVAGGAIYCFAGSLTINNSLLQGNSSAERGGAIHNDGCMVTINNSTLRSNRTLNNISQGGAIYNQTTGKLVVNQTLLQDNQSPDGGGLYVADNSTAALNGATLLANRGGYGGGLENSGVVTVTQSLLDGNIVTGSGGGLWNLGGYVVMKQTTVRNNRAYEGGGINSYGNAVELTDINITDNVATGSHGGGIYHGAGTLFVTNATISGNRANDSAGNGGGVYQNSNDNLVLTNITLANNWAGGFGGGFYHYARYAILTNVTITDNNAGLAGAAIYEDAPMTPASPGIIQITSSVIAGSANNCDGPMFQSIGYNISSGTCASLDHPTDRDNYSGNLLLGPLAFNGGAFAMNTRLPQAGSPLINMGNATFCTALDQRGAPRAGACDIGAVEYGVSLQREVYLPLVKRMR